MSHARELLDLAAAGDERGLKRAYARLLKQTRPDEDPEGFQRLHDLYQRALARCHAARERDAQAAPAWEDTEADVAIAETAPVTAPRTPATAPINVTATPAVAPIDLALPAQPDPDKAGVALLRAGAEMPPEAFPSWLQKESREWSLDMRDAISTDFLLALRQDDVVMCSTNLQTLVSLFGWDDVSSGVDIRELQRLTDRACSAWLQLLANHGELAKLLPKQDDRQLTQSEVAGWLDALQKPHPHLRNVMATALWPEHVDMMHAFMSVLGCQPGAPLPAGINGGQATFWIAVADPLHRFKLHVSLFRSVLLGMLFMLACAVTLYAMDMFSDPRKAASIAGWLLGSLALPSSIVLFRFAQGRLYQYQVAAEDAPTPRPWLRISTIPLLTGAAALAWPLLTYHPAIFIFIGWPLAWKILRLAQIRFRRRRGASLDGGAFMLFCMLVSVCLVAPALVGAMLYWLLDLLRHGRVLRWRAPMYD